ncbi:MAG TPA: DUF4412 domain-containing protein [Candidatus Aminicenantes bacterium]|mgnify:CR=1 FL=1|nr:DUF4412 domain-containing protein [Candidatus Aminicenantes bacterium]
MKKIVWLLCLLFFMGGLIYGDYFIKEKSHTDAIQMMGQSQPARDEVMEMWISQDLKKMAANSSEQSMIIDLNKNLMYLVDHQNKSYVEMDLPLDISKYVPAQMAQMMNQMANSVTIEVTPTGQKKKIGQWECSEYDVVMNIMMMKMEMKVWATKDVPFSWEKVTKDLTSQVMAAQLRLNQSALQELLKVEGQWIASETKMNMMGNTVRSTTEVLEISEKDAPQGIYQVPAEYTKKEKLSMEDLQRR